MSNSPSGMSIEQGHHPVHEELGGYEGSKLGMWLFLATELLLFGVMFCAFAIFHAKFVNEFKLAHHSLDKIMGGINTVVLILSSLTVALAIDRIQRGKQKAAVWLLAATIAFAGCFLVVKYFEYTGKFHHEIFPGNAKNIIVDDKTHAYGPIPKYLHVATSQPISAAGEVAALDEIVRKASPSGKQAVADALAEKGAALVDKKGIDLFFTFYFMMTGIHGLHVIIGMSVLFVIMIKTMRGTYSHWHYTAMENGGLYWHLVDLIWIYLFPLMYLIK